MANTITAGNATNGGTAVLSDASGALSLVTGSGAGTTALTIDGSQNAIFVGGANFPAAYSGTYSNGTIVDFASGVGRITVGSATPLTFNNGGTASRVETARIEANGFMYSSPNGLGAGVNGGLVPGMMTYIVNANFNLNGTLTTTQNALGVATPTLQPGRYRFKFFWGFIKNSGTGQFSFGLGGTATFTYGSFHAIARLGATFTSASTPNDVFLTTTTPATPIIISNPTVAISNNNAIVDGYFDISVAGTVFPGVGWSVAPGSSTPGTYATNRGTYMEIWPVATDTSNNTNIGNWA